MHKPLNDFNFDQVNTYDISVNRLSNREAGHLSGDIPISDGNINYGLNSEYLGGFKNTQLAGNDVLITNQEEFDAVMSGTIPANTSIFLKKGENPYLLNNAVVLSSGVRITSDGAVVNRNSATARFSTTYKNSATYSSGGLVGDITILRTAGTPFIAGDIITWSGVEFYSVVSDTTTSGAGGTVTISTPIRTTAASGTIISCQQNIFTAGWVFDGQGDVNSLGPSTGAFNFSENGGAFSIEYCANSTFKAEVRNCATAGGYAGGAYYGGGMTYNNIIENINNCFSSVGGGGCESCPHSVIFNISYCTAITGGGCRDCYYSTISNISYCTADHGGGCYSCYYSTISNISYCTATTGGGGCQGCYYSTISNISYCTADYGGGCRNCYYSTISNISYCTATYNGGGCRDCYYSTISNIRNCTADSGGGCYNCYYCDISNIINNTTNTNSVGACHNCNNCFYHGAFYSNGNTNSTTPNITSGGTSLATCIAGADSAKVVTTQGTWVDW